VFDGSSGELPVASSSARLPDAAADSIVDSHRHIPHIPSVLYQQQLTVCLVFCARPAWYCCMYCSCLLHLPRAHRRFKETFKRCVRASSSLTALSS
jgi:hypothetical protein